MKGQGIANLFTGFLGGMGGCAMIGQSVINVKSGGETRLSTFVAGTSLLFLIVVLGPLVAQIPTAATAPVMVLVSIDRQSSGEGKRASGGHSLGCYRSVKKTKIQIDV